MLDHEQASDEQWCARVAARHRAVADELHELADQLDPWVMVAENIGRPDYGPGEVAHHVNGCPGQTGVWRPVRDVQTAANLPHCLTCEGMVAARR